MPAVSLPPGGKRQYQEEARLHQQQPLIPRTIIKSRNQHTSTRPKSNTMNSLEDHSNSSDEGSEDTADSTTSRGHDHGAISPFLSAGFFSFTMILGIASLCAVIFIFISYYILGVIHQIAELPTPYQYFAYAGLTLLVVVILAFLLRLSYLWVRLRRTPSVDLGKINELLEQPGKQGRAQRETALAKKTLTKYVKRYPADGLANEKRLNGLGMKEKEIKQLQEARHALLDQSRGLADSDWLEEFDDEFVAILNTVAHRDVKRRAFLVGVKTAGLPNKVLDVLVATYGAIAITDHVCRIYNLRTGRFGTLVIMVKSFGNIYLAGRLEEATEAIGNKIIGETASIIGTIFTTLAKKVAEGSANALLSYRLGNSVIKLVQPIRK